ncbi:C-terminal binding protein [Bacillus piscicola]|uniref:C-terminal binding protein n=1 Tax=Bacillus piscicola TaxID=1632684 RepID=UPI001F09C191|nr:C-terminal binding protein [Bacillus piscicola]
MKNVYITDHVMEDLTIEKDILGDYYSEESKDEIEVLLVWRNEITKEVIDQYPNLRGMVRFGVGFENFDLDYAREKGIYVCNNPDYGTDEVSDTAITMIMNIARGMTGYDYHARSYRDTWQANTNPAIHRTSSTVVGFIGAGRIGGSTILKANHMNFQTVFYDPYKERGHDKLLGAKRVESLDDLLKESDIISVHAPLTKETVGMIDENFISKMKDGASLVNTGRGKILKNTDVIYDALRTGKLANVALDVMPDEPPKDDKLIEAWRNREDWLGGRLIINPHSAFYSQEAFLELRQKAANTALMIAKGERPYNIVNGL